MKEQMEERIKNLKAELESGQKIMEDLEAKRMDLSYTILRISGAIQVLEELLKADTEASNGSSPAAASQAVE